MIRCLPQPNAKEYTDHLHDGKYAFFKVAGLGNHDKDSDSR